MNFRSLAIASLALALSQNAPACSLCGCGDPMESARYTPPRAGQWRLGLDQERLSVVTAGDGDPASRDALTQNTTRFSLGYSPMKDLSLLLKIPWNEKVWSSYGGGDPAASGVTAGLGDLDLGGRWFFALDSDMEARSARYAALTFGSSFNTGANDLASGGQREDEHTQPGTGALGPYAGLFVGLESGDWTFVSHIDYHFHATNAHGYSYGSALKAGVKLRKDTSSATALSIGLEGRYADFDHDGEALANTGGTLLHLVPGLHLRLGMSTALTLQAQLPLIANLFGVQQNSPVYMASLQFLLD